MIFPVKQRCGSKCNRVAFTIANGGHLHQFQMCNRVFQQTGSNGVSSGNSTLPELALLGPALRFTWEMAHRRSKEGKNF